jgi:uncharacterized membrane protein YebE (DUF533 family)
MDTNRLLGALLAGVLTPARPKRARTTRKPARPARRRTARPVPLIDLRIGGSRRTGSALAALATLAAEALAQATAPAPRAPAPAGPVPVPYPTAARGSPWSTAAPTPPPPPDPVGAEDREALLVVRAMIAAARADGAIEADERQAIAGQLDQAGLEPEARELVLAEFASPAPIEVLAREITDPVLAAQVYAACVIAVGAQVEGERAWLAAFARRTGLGPETVAAIERRLAVGAAQG